MGRVDSGYPLMTRDGMLLEGSIRHYWESIALIVYVTMTLLLYKNITRLARDKSRLFKDSRPDCPTHYFHE